MGALLIIAKLLCAAPDETEPAPAPVVVETEREAVKKSAPDRDHRARLTSWLRVLAIPAYAVGAGIWGVSGLVMAWLTAAMCGVGCSGCLWGYFLPINAFTLLVYTFGGMLGYVGMYIVMLGLYAPFYWLYLIIPLVFGSAASLAVDDDDLTANFRELDPQTLGRVFAVMVRSVAAYIAGAVASFALWVIQASAMLIGFTAASVAGGLLLFIVLSRGGTTGGVRATDTEMWVALVLGVYVAAGVFALGTLVAFVPLGLHAAVLAGFRPEQFLGGLLETDLSAPTTSDEEEL